jgi:hypothetical protein
MAIQLVCHTLNQRSEALFPLKDESPNGNALLLASHCLLTVYGRRLVVHLASQAAAQPKKMLAPEP